MSMDGGVRFDFRFVRVCGEPWFCGAVCAATGVTANALSSRFRTRARVRTQIRRF